MKGAEVRIEVLGSHGDELNRLIKRGGDDPSKSQLAPNSVQASGVARLASTDIHREEVRKRACKKR
jgi:hypothetical protein